MTGYVEASLVEPVRVASRRLVRALGFLNGALAGTDLPPSAVHALIEIDRRPGLTAQQLAAELRLDKSSVSRLLGNLARAGDVAGTPSSADRRARQLALTPQGTRRVQAIHAFATQQVRAALGQLTTLQRSTVLDGLELYAAALDPQAQNGQAGAEIVDGYRPGVIGDIAGLHARYYARTSQFGQRFESLVAGGLAEFCGRLDKPGNALWTVWRGGRVCASIAIDGEDLGPGVAHLRWFIVDDGLRGTGLGRDLLRRALTFVDAQGCRETRLTTFAGLDAARRLYEASGFGLVDEQPGSNWGREVCEQLFVRPAAGEADTSRP